MIPGDGPIPAKIMLVGEAPGEEEQRQLKPFVGNSGIELNRLLQEAKILRNECFVTNLVRVQPPRNDITQFIPLKKKEIGPRHVPLRDKMVLPVVIEGFEALKKEVALVRPHVIVAFGNAALWALTGLWTITRWRGSQLWTDEQISPTKIKLIPTVHPAAVLREWSWRSIVLNDLRRAAKERFTPGYSNVPAWHFHIRPSFEAVVERLNALLEQLDVTQDFWIDFDLETSIATGHIDCAGISWSKTEGLSIPLMSRTNKEGYWAAQQEGHLIWLLYRVLTHKNVKVRGQNLLFDCQYTHRWWGFVPRVAQDTMISHHTAFCGMRKSLDFQASLYCDYYRQWKPDKSEWKEGG